MCLVFTGAMFKINSWLCIQRLLIRVLGKCPTCCTNILVSTKDHMPGLSISSWLHKKRNLSVKNSFRSRAHITLPSFSLWTGIPPLLLIINEHTLQWPQSWVQLPASHTLGREARVILLWLMTGVCRPVVLYQLLGTVTRIGEWMLITEAVFVLSFLWRAKVSLTSSVFYFPWQLWYQDAMAPVIALLVPGSWHCDALCEHTGVLFGHWQVYMAFCLTDTMSKMSDGFKYWWGALQLKCLYSKMQMSDITLKNSLAIWGKLNIC